MNPSIPKEPTAEEPLIVAGAGLAGSLMALYLARRGYYVDIYERRPDSRDAEFLGGRSINLALSTRGLNALEGVGLKDKILEKCIPMHGRLIHKMNGQTELHPYGKEGQFINSVERRHLNEVLMNAADAHDHVNFHFEKKVVNVALADGSPMVEDMQSGEISTVKTRYLFGADGAFSAVRGALQKTGRFNYAQDYLSHAYKELTIPAGPDGSWLMEKNALHIWPRHDFMLIALPNLDGSFTVTLFLAYEGEHSFSKLRSEGAAIAFFDTFFKDALKLMPNFEKDFFDNPRGDLVTIKCSPFHYTDQVLLIGDAAHAVVPFYGQGMNASFEDCFLVDRLLDSLAPDWGELGRQFSKERKADAHAIADLAIYNFLEMRSKVSNKNFLLKKKVDKQLHKWFPKKWIPLYSMVTFSNIPYAQARERATRQDKILRKAGWLIFLLIAFFFFSAIVFGRTFLL